MAVLKLPRLLEGSVSGGLRHDVPAGTLEQALNDLFTREPGLRNHILDESGAIRPHVILFVDGNRARLDTEVPEHGAIQVLQAVSGG
ncbi:MAG: MoaD/ThiS family protein [Acidimicrobiia bacterium]